MLQYHDYAVTASCIAATKFNARGKCWTAIQEPLSSILLLEGCASSDEVGGSDTCSQFYLLSSNRDPLSRRREDSTV